MLSRMASNIGSCSSLLSGPSSSSFSSASLTASKLGTSFTLLSWFGPFSALPSVPFFFFSFSCVDLRYLDFFLSFLLKSCIFFRTSARFLGFVGKLSFLFMILSISALLNFFWHSQTVPLTYDCEQPHICPLSQHSVAFGLSG